MSGTGKITGERFEAMLADTDVPDSEIAEYLVGKPEYAKIFFPGIGINTAKVEIRASELEKEYEKHYFGAATMKWANKKARDRRAKRFAKRRAAGEQWPVVVSEGDSWSQFPFFLKDVVDHLEPDHLVYDVAAGGATLADMIYYTPEFDKAFSLAGPDVRAFIFSGGGNDCMGLLREVLRPYSPGKSPAWYLETQGFEQKLAFIRDAYRELLTRMQSIQPRLPAVLHGYDYAIPHSGEQDERRPVYAQWDGWLAAPLRSIGIDDAELQRNIIQEMVDRLNETQKKVCAAFPMAHHVDLRGTLSKITDWADELHPTNAGFGNVAEKIRRKLHELL